ncbi:unnamed protein product [Acanthoscelides obtectus]|uniref:Glucose-methanol-choline oxidoreductase N-terminal domain-containing protein n=1 Tax=Acanthoscelides obtectus TaxID=200917 RepID=A0A9P0M5K1_ACAOB|nr:unnamed protein product [Acanthoscelides obtectus]CAK1629217.1 Glucose dehydrogenase [FAD, quinone] [Acanthoscelides obtectus]
MFQIIVVTILLQAKCYGATSPPILGAIENVTTDTRHSFNTLMEQIVYGLMNASADFQSVYPMYPITDKPYLDDYFDFIVVGAGPSGCVIANRLTENKHVTVLLLEAGEEPSALVEIPILAFGATVSKYSWWYKPEPQKETCTGCINGRTQWYHGKGLGGSTLINLMLYVRGHKSDFDDWERQGNDGWGYDDVLPLFKRSEQVHVKVYDKEYHGRHGYLSTSDPSYASRLSQVWVQAAQEAGYAYVDYNGKSQIGVSFLQSTTLKGRREHAEKAFLRPFRYRQNLVIRKNSIVTKILIDPNTKAAYGVEYESMGKTFTVTCKKEVILSAGVFSSPKLLMLSGVGPKETLERFDVPVIQDLPVGKIMYDHLFFPGLSFTVNKPITLNVLPYLKPQSYVDYVDYGSGTLGYCLAEVMHYINVNVTNSSNSNPEASDVELMVTGGSVVADFGFWSRRYLNIPQELYDKIWKPLEFVPVFMVVPVLLHPKSKGHMTLLSKDPKESPLFFPNYFTDPENHDIKIFIGSIREAQRIIKSPSLRKYDAKIVDTPIPGCEVHGFDTDEYWECALRTLMSSIYHQTTTCKMGPPSDPEAVVNPKLQVYGVKNLRVADVSIVPLTISGHTQAAAYMIGEKASDILKERYHL